VSHDDVQVPHIPSERGVWLECIWICFSWRVIQQGRAVLRFCFCFVVVAFVSPLSCRSCRSVEMTRSRMITRKVLSW